MGSLCGEPRGGDAVKDFLQVLIIGLGNGAIYAMLGLGLVVIYRATGLLNFAQGELAMFSTFIVWTIWNQGVPLWLAVLGGMVGGFLIGAVLHQVVVRPVGDPHEKPLAVVIVTIGLFLGLNGLAQLIWGTSTRSFPTCSATAGRDLRPRRRVAEDRRRRAWPSQAFVFYLLFQRTRLGLAMRAVASNPESAGLVGVPVPTLLMVGWGLAAAVGAVAGMFTAPGRGLGTNLMQLTLIFGFAAITLGGFDSLVGAVVGGFVVGICRRWCPSTFRASPRSRSLPPSS